MIKLLNTIISDTLFVPNGSYPMCHQIHCTPCYYQYLMGCRLGKTYLYFGTQQPLEILNVNVLLEHTKKGLYLLKNKQSSR